MIEILLAANLVTYFSNQRYQVESCTATPFEIVVAQDALWPTDTYELEGSVELQVFVNNSGKVISSEITNSVPQRVFYRSAKRAILKWVFGESTAIERCFNVTFLFELKE